MDLLEDVASNAPALSVSEVSGAVKRVIEGEFARVRVRGEISRVSRPASGHLYFDLKDDRAVIAAVCWKANACRLPHRPEEGLEVIATGRLTTFPGASKYQILVETIEPAGAGALMAMLEARRKALATEGLFDAARKRPIPYLPGVIGVITSPSGAVIRDILHRLRDRFPSRVLVWPVAVQGAACAPEVAAAITGFNALKPGGPIPRPDLLIVARGGGSIEDLWGFNDEAVVRAVAAGTIPLISAVGHETDTTLIDHAADLRAPTPTAAAEMAVPVRSELLARMADHAARQLRSAQGRVAQPKQRLADLARALGRPQAITETARQRLDYWADDLEPSLQRYTLGRRATLERLQLSQGLLLQRLAECRAAIARQQPDLALRRSVSRSRSTLGQLVARHRPELLARQPAQARQTLAATTQRLQSARTRFLAAEQRRTTEGRAQLSALTARLAPAATRGLTLRAERLDRLDRLRQTLGYRETLTRGFAVVHGPSGLVASAAEAKASPRMEIEFADGRVPVRPEGTRQRPGKTPQQGSLF